MTKRLCNWMTSIKKLTSTVLLVGILLTVNGSDRVFANQEMASWPFQKEISLQDSEGYHYFFLDEEVYRNARRDLADLRIMDGHENIVPYFIDSGYGETGIAETTYRSELVQTMEKETATIVDFLVHPVNSTTDVQGNLLVVGLPNREFLRFVHVYGSYDGQRWDPLGEHMLYNTGQLKRDTIPLDHVYKYTYYRLELLDNLEKIEPEELQVVYSEKLSDWFHYSRSRDLPFEVEHEDRLTIIQLQNENRLRIAAIRFSLEGNFRRAVSVTDPQGRPLAIQGESELYQLQFEGVQLDNQELLFDQPVAAEDIIITIRNEDSPPLEIQELTVDYYIDRIVFEANDEGPLRLLYGNPDATKPVYDLANFKTYILREQLHEASLSKEMVQPGFTETDEKDGWGSLSFQTIFQIAVVLASIVLVVLIGTKLAREKKG